MIAAEQKNLSRYLTIAALFGNADETAKAKAHRHKLRRRIHMLERSSAKLLSTQTSVQKQFTDLRDLVMEKKHRLYELLALNRLYEEVSDVEVNCLSSYTANFFISQQLFSLLVISFT